MKVLGIWIMCGGLFLAGCATPPAPVSHDGLHLVQDKGWDQLYVKPDIDIADYHAFALQPCTVAFRDNWMRSQNSGRNIGGQRVSERDMQEIQERLAAVCDEYFEKSLRQEPAYRLVAEGETPEAAQYDTQTQVLELKPAIIDLDIHAPDIDGATKVRSYTTSFGEMTLLLEAYDARSGEIVARIVDRKVDQDSMNHLQWTNRVTNMADAKRYMRSWTRSLRNHLDASR
ncbi:DUF3313 domain-containing protein [Gilvimarinus agarilyticus]|uniref:DUF3313 family protein n=1 Tax=Gilvimarinus sp. 2_MG-2023 TaxID=3062666 RepID=UPI001C09D338|nr:DUF3313 family protein [Gilvimarinus sp. 2_MG-2023]MBU2884648.1 DUF3313 domain-containing protein [Gilvimarinus agarilyticus]MDO6569755.1 DUF3313 family protein [Gilvimarinus sp. 2_MG-2023]